MQEEQTVDVLQGLHKVYFKIETPILKQTA